MLASIRQAIHEETAHQAAGLHAPAPVPEPELQDDVVCARHAPEPEEPVAAFSRPEFLRPLSQDGADADIEPAAQAQAAPEPREETGEAAPAQAGRNSITANRRVLGGVLGGALGLDEARARLGEPPAAPRPQARRPSVSGGLSSLPPAADAGDAFLPAAAASQGAETEADADAHAGADAAENLLSPRTAAAVSGAFARLRGELEAEERLPAMTEEMLRPMLRAWLDENLPAIVERLVREEIERIARNGGKG